MSSIPPASGGLFEVPDLSVPASGGLFEVRHSCVGCAALSPPAESSFTLISTRYGWRLRREQDPRSGEVRFEWRCPRCWDQHRKEVEARFRRGRSGPSGKSL